MTNKIVIGIIAVICGIILIAGIIYIINVPKEKPPVVNPINPQPQPPVNSQSQVYDDSKATTEGVNSLINANNQFSFEVYKKLSEDDKNLFISPFSISSALSITYEGAKGNTADEMQKVFHFPKEDITRRSSYARLYNEINKLSKNYSLNVANSLWPEQSYKFLPDYISTVTKYYDSKLTNLDYKSDPDGSRVTINKWVENKTNDKIKDLLSKGIITPQTRLVIANAIYFKGKWQYEFDAKNTYDEDFNTGSSIEKVKMMNLNEKSFNYYEGSGLKAIELPYSGDEMSMLILLPDDMKSFENSLTSTKLNDIKSKMSYEEISQTMIPKFKFNTKYGLVDKFREMGMKDAFDFGKADFSGMDGTKNLAITAIIHQAYVDVNEEGTEAAAATAVVVSETSAGPSEPKVFKADHPFIFLIQDKHGNVLFLGKVVNPNLS